MHPCPEHSISSLEDGSKSNFCRCCKVTNRPNITGDVLWKANDALRATISTFPRSEFSQRARKKKHLLKVCALVGIDALRKNSSHKWNCMVLIVSFSITQNWVAWKLDPVFCLLLPIWQIRTSPVDETAEVSALLLWVDHVKLSSNAFVFAVDECNFQAIWELPKHSI